MGLQDSSREFIPLLFHSSSLQTEPLTSAQTGREKEAEITSAHPKPSLERAAPQNLGGKGITGFDGSLFSGLPKALGSIKGAVPQWRHFKRALSCPDTQSRGEQAPCTQILCLLYIFIEKLQTSRGETPESQTLGYLLYKRI